MLWLIYSLITAVFTAVQGVFYKKAVKKVDEYIVTFSFLIFTVLFLAPFVFYFGIPELGNDFFLILMISGILNALALILYIRAIKLSDISITMPLLAFTPFFLLLTSPFIVHESPSSIGLLGVVLVVVGSYILNISKLKEGFFEPFKALINDKGAKLMFFVAILWSITSNIDKIGIGKSSSIFWGFSVYAVMVLFIFPFAVVRFLKGYSRSKHFVLDNTWLYAAAGLFHVIVMYSQYAALKLALVSYVISVKRASAIFSVIFGFLIFKEKGFKERLLGVSIMVAGVIIIAFS
jgi:uncharacterized membrane protein